MDDPEGPGGGLDVWRRRGVAATMRGLRDGGRCDWASAMHRCMRPYVGSTIMEIDGFASRYRDAGGMNPVEAVASLCLIPRLFGVDDDGESDRVMASVDALDSVIENGIGAHTYEAMMLSVLGWSWHQEFLYDDYTGVTGNMEIRTGFRLGRDDAENLLRAMPKAVDMIGRVRGLKDAACRAKASGYPVIGPMEAASMLAVAIVLGLDPKAALSAADVFRICTLRGDPRPVDGPGDGDGGAAWDGSMITLAMYQDVRDPGITRAALSALLARPDPLSTDGADFDEAAMTVLKALRSMPRKSGVLPRAYAPGAGYMGRYVHRMAADRMSPRIVSGGMSPSTAAAIIRMSSVIQRAGDAILPIIDDRSIMSRDAEDAICGALKDAMRLDLEGFPSGFVRQTLAYGLSPAAMGHDRAVTRR